MLALNLLRCPHLLFAPMRKWRAVRNRPPKKRGWCLELTRFAAEGGKQRNPGFAAPGACADLAGQLLLCARVVVVFVLEWVRALVFLLFPRLSSFEDGAAGFGGCWNAHSIPR